MNKRAPVFTHSTRPLVVYCQTGLGAAKAKEILSATGVKDVTNAGGLSDLRTVAK